MSDEFDKVNSWADTMEHASGYYLYSKISSKGSLYATCYRIMLAHVTKDIDTWSQSKKDILAEKIISCRADDGFFNEIDTEYTSKKHNTEYTKWHLTMCAVCAITVLNPEIKNEFKFLNKYANKSFLNDYLKNLNFKASWNTSNIIMAICSLMSAAYQQKNEQRYLDLILLILDHIESLQDKKSGLWGPNYGASLVNSMAGTYHYLMFYYYLKRPIPLHNKMIQVVTSLQAPSGHFGVCGASSCLDLDGLDIIAHGGNEYNLSIGIKSCLSCQNENGGFTGSSNHFYLSDLNYIIRLLKIDQRSFRFNLRLVVKQMFFRKRVYYGGSLKICSTNLIEPNMWASYARIIAIHAAEKALKTDKGRYNNLPFPTLGYI